MPEYKEYLRKKSGTVIRISPKRFKRGRAWKNGVLDEAKLRFKYHAKSHGKG